MLTALILSMFAQDAALDTSAAERIAVLHRGRPKPFESFAREFLHEVAGSPSFRGQKGTPTAAFFREGGAVAAVLRLIARPENEVRALQFIRIDHLQLKNELKLDVKQLYFSLADLEVVRPKLEEMERAIADEENATVQERAILMIAEKHWMIDMLCREQLLKIVPVSYGKTWDWPTPSDLRTWLAGGSGDERFAWVKAALDKHVEGNPDRRARLQAASDAYERMIAAVRDGKPAEFKSASADVASALAQVNPAIYPAARVIDAELEYNALHPYSWAAMILGLAALVYLFSFVFDSQKLWVAGVVMQFAAIAIHGYGYALRWIASGQYPLSNHYEAMATTAVAACVVSVIFELFLKARLIGMAGGIAAFVLSLLSDNVSQFAAQSFINPLQPALMNTIWMTIHVPTILTGFACTLILSILGHTYLIYSMRRPDRIDVLEQIHAYMYRLLQVTVLLIMGGTILGAGWAGEAWGRPWGWDMKEVWALITLLTYLATLHARFAGAIKAFGLAVVSVFGFFSVILCWYGVNFVFGKGLHTYGFGSGEQWVMILPVVVFFALESLLVAAAVARRSARRRESERALAPEPVGLDEPKA